MDAPQLVLVPPTPAYSNPSPSPSARTTATGASSNSGQAQVDKDRSSSETTIFTIYSMYGDEAARGSWSASASLDETTVSKPISLDSDTSFRNSVYQSSRYTSTDLAYFDSPAGSRTTSRHLSSVTSTSNGSARIPSYIHPRASSVHVTSLSPRIGLGIPDDSSASSTQKHRYSADPHAGIDLGEPLLHARPPRSRPPSSYRKSEAGPSELPSIPPPPRSSPPRTPPTSNLHLPPPSTPPSPMRLQSKPVSPASKISLVPSEGEDVDSFHVRSTYAQLDTYGVKGDGYEEGVERTRARIGANRSSELRAEEALGDGGERMRDLTPKEIETLASLDRYGFFTIPSHDRLVRLASAPLTKRLSPTVAGPSSAPTNAPVLSALPPVPQPPKENNRIGKWARMLQPLKRDAGANIEVWGIKPSKEHKLRERTYKGIPDRWRAAAWELLMSRFPRSSQPELAKWAEAYREALDKPSTYDVQIDLDVPRTISGHIMFRTRYGAGQRSLFHVLHCFSMHCEQCGYVQGMGPIAATLLCYFAPDRVYASLLRLHDAYAMHTIFSPGFPGLLEAIYIQERITEMMMPDVYAAFKKHMISTTSYATKWYITLFANSVPFQTQLRLWDVFLLEGQDVFVAVAVAIVWVYRDHITSASANFETVLSLLSSFFVPEDENKLLSWIEKMLGDKKLRTNMNQWRQHWKELVRTGQDSKALL